jgi:hypothetical protein
MVYLWLRWLVWLTFRMVPTGFTNGLKEQVYPFHGLCLAQQNSD